MQEIIDTGLKKADIGHVEGILSEMIFFGFDTFITILKL